MDPNDPRHGSSTGYRYGCREACCRRAAADRQADARKRYYLQRTDTFMTSPLGTRRRIQALAALGWSTAEVSRRAGYSKSHLGLMMRREKVRVDTARRVATIYDALSMQLPPETTKTQKIDASRARRMARENGWAPPLAWQDIDDPAERPDGWHYTRPNRAAILADLDAQGAHLSEACRRLELRRESLERWCFRNEMREVFRRLVERERSAA